MGRTIIIIGDCSQASIHAELSNHEADIIIVDSHYAKPVKDISGSMLGVSRKEIIANLEAIPDPIVHLAEQSYNPHRSIKSSNCKIRRR